MKNISFETIFAMNKRNLFKCKFVSHWRKSAGCLCLLFCEVLLCLLWSIQAPAQVNAGTEYKFKAVYLYNFLQFIEWPSQAFQNANSPLVVGIIGQDPFNGILDQTVRDENVHGRRIIVQQISKVEEAKHCHLVFISKSERERLPGILSVLNDANVLTVSEVDDFTKLGGGINFFLQNGKLRFEVNIDVLRKADLRMSSKLLRLAKVVQNKTSEE